MSYWKHTPEQRAQAMADRAARHRRKSAPLPEEQAERRFVLIGKPCAGFRLWEDAKNAADAAERSQREQAKHAADAVENSVPQEDTPEGGECRRIPEELTDSDEDSEGAAAEVESSVQQEEAAPDVENSVQMEEALETSVQMEESLANTVQPEEAAPDVENSAEMEEALETSVQMEESLEHNEMDVDDRDGLENNEMDVDNGDDGGGDHKDADITYFRSLRTGPGRRAPRQLDFIEINPPPAPIKANVTPPDVLADIETALENQHGEESDWFKAHDGEYVELAGSLISLVKGIAGREDVPVPRWCQLMERLVDSLCVVSIDEHGDRTRIAKHVRNDEVGVMQTEIMQLRREVAQIPALQAEIVTLKAELRTATAAAQPLPRKSIRLSKNAVGLANLQEPVADDPIPDAPSASHALATAHNDTDPATAPEAGEATLDAADLEGADADNDSESSNASSDESSSSEGPTATDENILDFSDVEKHCADLSPGLSRMVMAFFTWDADVAPLTLTVVQMWKASSNVKSLALDTVRTDGHVKSATLFRILQLYAFYDRYTATPKKEKKALQEEIVAEATVAGLKLTWANHHALAQTVHKIISRLGPGFAIHMADHFDELKNWDNPDFKVKACAPFFHKEKAWYYSFRACSIPERACKTVYFDELVQAMLNALAEFDDDALGIACGNFNAFIKLRDQARLKETQKQQRTRRS